MAEDRFLLIQKRVVINYNLTHHLSKFPVNHHESNLDNGNNLERVIEDLGKATSLHQKIRKT